MTSLGMNRALEGGHNFKAQILRLAAWGLEGWRQDLGEERTGNVSAFSS